LGTWADFYGETPGERIDVDRGVRRRSTPDGHRIASYKAQPGLYLDARSNEVEDEVARLVGFDVDGDRKEARILKEISEATKVIRARSDQVEAEIRARVEIEESSPAATPFDLGVDTPPASGGVAVGEEPKQSDEAAGKTVTLSELFTTFNARGLPRGTAHYIMDHQGRGIWDITGRDGSETSAKSLRTEEALVELCKAEERYLKGDIEGVT